MKKYNVIYGVSINGVLSNPGDTLEEKKGDDKYNETLANLAKGDTLDEVKSSSSSSKSSSNKKSSDK